MVLRALGRLVKRPGWRPVLAGLLGLLVYACVRIDHYWAPFSGPWPSPVMAATNGTGIIVADGLVLTAGHVARGCKVIRLAAASDGFRAVPATVRAFGPKHDDLELDVALLEAVPSSAASWPPARFGDLWPATADLGSIPRGADAEMQLSAAIMLLGYPNGTVAPRPAIVPVAHLAAVRPGDVSRFHLWSFLGDAEPGLSGGPVVDPAGTVLGLAFKGRPAHDPALVRLGIPEGLGLAVSSRDLIQFLEQSDVPVETARRDLPARPITDSLVEVFCFR